MLALLALALLSLPPTSSRRAEAQDRPPSSSAPVIARFAAIDVYVDAGAIPLAAYQFEFEAKGDVRLVGLEGGEHAAFREAPCYDPAALEGGRVIVAAFSTGSDLPVGRTRVATLHLRISVNGEPECSVRLHVAAASNGTKIPAGVSWVRR